MRTHNKALFYCDNDFKSDITELLSIPGITMKFCSEPTELAGELDKLPGALLIQGSLLCQETSDILHENLGETPCAIIADVVCSEHFPALMEIGVSTFIAKGRLKKGIISFLDAMLTSDKKSKTLLSALHRMRKLAENATDGIIILDEQCNISFINKTVSDMLDTPRADILGKTMDEIFNAHPFKMTKEDEQQSYEEFEFETADGEKHTFTSTCSSTYEKGEYSGCVIIINKLTRYQEARKAEIDLLKYQQRYHSIQQNMAFKKQMLILKDEMSNIKTQNFAIETYFKPLDILSGDSYGSLNLKDGRYLFYIIDAMGKGLSASVTALQSISFINHSVELSLIKDDFDLSKTISSFLHYIRDRLMDEEALCCAFALLDSESEQLTVANYGMPPIYTADMEGNVQMHRPNNLPIMRCLSDRNTTTIDLTDVDKVLMMSDGLLESRTADDGIYAEKMPEHFRAAYTKKHLLSMVNEQILSNDDDITFFFIKRDTKITEQGLVYQCNSSVDEIIKLGEDVGNQMRSDGVNEADCATLEYALSEILMNAMEHGNLGIDFNMKQKLIAKGEYDQYLSDHTALDSNTYKKKITLKYKYLPRSEDTPGTVFLSVTDEGRGFSPANLFKYHTFDGNLCHVDKKNYNGRGIFISDNLLDGLYYNETGNCACMLKLVDPEA